MPCDFITIFSKEKTHLQGILCYVSVYLLIQFHPTYWLLMRTKEFSWPHSSKTGIVTKETNAVRSTGPGGDSKDNCQAVDKPLPLTASLVGSAGSQCLTFPPRISRPLSLEIKCSHTPLTAYFCLCFCSLLISLLKILVMFTFHNEDYKNYNSNKQ